MKHLIDLQDRVAIVTGAASGIGRGTAQLLAELGAHVIATDRDGAALARAQADLGALSVTSVVHDVCSEEDWARVLAAADETGRLDILVNNAGIMLDTPFIEAPLQDLQRQYQINVEGPFIGMQQAVPLMKSTVARNGATASIINVSSIYGQVAGSRYAAYSASKGAIRSLTKAVANELATSGIRVNSIHPGPTATNLGAAHAVPTDETGQPLPLEAVVAMWRRLIPLGRGGRVEDIVPMIAFLASDAAQYITGAELVIDGGYTAI